ncbi:hypothetical protein JCM10207_005508 [Rhodosporidiobolus poonsookiae]
MPTPHYNQWPSAAENTAVHAELNATRTHLREAEQEVREFKDWDLDPSTYSELLADRRDLQHEVASLEERVKRLQEEWHPGPWDVEKNRPWGPTTYKRYIKALKQANSAIQAFEAEVRLLEHHYQQAYTVRRAW